MNTKGQKIRAKIIGAANRLFYQRGFQAASFSDLARESGIPKGNYYFHFKAKEDLLAAVIQDRSDRLKIQLDHWRDTIENPKERLRRTSRMIERSRDDLVAYGCPLGTLVAETVKSHPSHKNQLAEMLRMIENWMAEQMVDLGLEPDQARRRARAFLGIMQGAAVLAAAYGDADVIAQAVHDLDTEIDTL
ncbi:MAG: TetR/AcrR family transcriptional regulator [Alphaproteobacteria bacterium]|nr:TetR/AcrR family transcriptional regulator [Alphaproteobacteria bacterium]